MIKLMIDVGKDIKSFSLIEVMVAVAVFALVVVAAGGVFISIQNSWRIQRTDIDLVQNARWAMEFMGDEVRESGNLNVVSGDRLRFELPPGGPANRVWYWRGDGGGFGAIDIIYRGTGAGLGGANGNRQELANLIANNTSGNNIFIDPSAVGDQLTIEITTSRDNRTHTLRSQIRPRN